MWTQIVLLVCSFVLQYAVQSRSSSDKPTPAAQDEFDFPLCDEGTEQPVVFGQVWTSTWFVLSVRNYRQTPIRTKSSKK